MRVLQLNPNGSEHNALDLHPTISIVTGLGEDGHNLVLDAFRAVASGRDPGMTGLLEAHGILFDLNTASLGVLDLHARADVVVGPDDITSAGSATGSGRPTFDRAQIERFLEEAPKGRYPHLDAARSSRANAVEARAILQEAVDKAKVKYEEVATNLRRTEAELEATRAAADRVRYVAEGDVRADDDDTEVVSIDEIRGMHAEIQAQIAELEAMEAQITRGLQELAGLDVRPLVVLLDAIRSPSPVELVPSERAQELADDVRLLEDRVAELERALDEQGMSTAAVMSRLEECRAELAAAERSMQKPDLSPGDIEELEAAHERVLEAEQKASSGLFKGGARKALDEALSTQQAILDRVGFPTWTAYVMGASLLSIDPIAEQRVERARLDLEAAETHWTRITEAIESNPEHRTLLNRLEEVYLEAYDLLGGEEPEDLETALRTLQVPKREVTIEELADALAYQLELLGLPLGESPSVDLVVMAAEAFLEEANAVSGRIEELKGDRAKVDAALADARMRLGELPPLPAEDKPMFLDDSPALTDFGGWAPLGGGDGDGDDSFGAFGSFGDEEPAAAEEDSGFASFDDFPPLVPEEEPEDRPADAGDGGEVSSTRREARAAQIAELERALEVAIEEEAEYREWVESREALVDTALQIETVAATKLQKLAVEILASDADWVPDASSAVEDDGVPDPEAVTAFLRERIGALRQVSFAGSVPLVLDDALRALPTSDVRQVLAELEPDAALVQIVYLSDDPDLVGWADEVGFQRAAVVEAPPVFR